MSKEALKAMCKILDELRHFDRYHYHTQAQAQAQHTPQLLGGGQGSLSGLSMSRGQLLAYGGGQAGYHGTSVFTQAAVTHLLANFKLWMFTPLRVQRRLMPLREERRRKK